MLTFVILYISLVHAVFSISTYHKNSYFMDNNAPENDLADIISSKSYLPDEYQLPKASILKNEGDDVTYMLTKLSDEDLIKLLNAQPSKNEYDLNDIAKMAAGLNVNKGGRNFKISSNENYLDNNVLKKIKHNKNHDLSSKKEDNQMPFFRLENKIINSNSKNDAQYFALNKLNTLLKGHPHIYQDNSLDDDKKELLFDVLVNQLKTLCCKKSERQEINHLKLYDEFNPLQKAKVKRPNEFMFLIINDEIKSNSSSELILVDPETLQRNSSILLLGPITTPLSDRQLKLIMNRITNELSKPEYLTLLQQLSEGTLSDSNLRLMKHFMNGSDTRRYIKPHRCNHQSKLSRVYGGPKWLICTGYINLNTPSLYD